MAGSPGDAVAQVTLPAPSVQQAAGSSPTATIDKMCAAGDQLGMMDSQLSAASSQDAERAAAAEVCCIARPKKLYSSDFNIACHCLPSLMK